MQKKGLEVIEENDQIPALDIFYRLLTPKSSLTQKQSSMGMNLGLMHSCRRCPLTGMDRTINAVRRIGIVLMDCIVDASPRYVRLRRVID